MKFVPHEWEIVIADELRHVEKAVCPHCDMMRETIEGEIQYKIPAHTPSRWKPAIVPAGEGWPEPTCKSSLRALGLALKDKSLSKELALEEGCCTSWENNGVIMWECGGPGVCECSCHYIIAELEP